MSTQRPAFDLGHTRSSCLLAATVMTPRTELGVTRHASLACLGLLPAIVTTVMLCCSSSSIARLTALVLSPNRDMFTTARLLRCLTRSRMQSMPSTMEFQEPLRLQFRTRTENTFTPGAIPKSFPLTIPATCVPCPTQS